MMDADAAPGGALESVDGDVLFAADFGEGVADEQSRNAVGQTDFQGNGGALLENEFLQ